MTEAPARPPSPGDEGVRFGVRSLGDPRRPFSRLAAAFMVSSIGDPFSLAVSLIIVYSAVGSSFAIAAAYGCRAVAAILVGGLGGSLTDRVDRRQLLLLLDSGRFLVLVALPLLVRHHPFFIFPALFLLGGAESLAQPARLAGAVVLAPTGTVDRANSLLMTSYSVAQAIGFALAGIAITSLRHPELVYWIDAATFGVSALLTLTLPNLGGGIVTARFRFDALRQLAHASLRPLLLVTGGANLLIGVGTASLLPLAFVLVSQDPAAAYTGLQVALIIGLVAGSLILTRSSSRRPALAMAAGVATFGAGALIIAVSPRIELAAIGFAVTGVANAMYSIRNRTALMQRAGGGEQGSIMSTRYSIAQASQIVGLGAGGLVCSLAGPRSAFGVVGVGMLLVAAAFTLNLRRRPEPDVAATEP